MTCLGKGLSSHKELNWDYNAPSYDKMVGYNKMEVRDLVIKHNW